MKNKPIKTNVLLQVVTLLACAALGSCENCSSNQPPSAKKAEGACDSHGCHIVADELLATLDLSTDPCEDFYSFACGGWQRRHPLGNGDDHRDRFDEVKDTLDKHIRAVLEATWSPDEAAPVRCAQDAYAACADTETRQRAGLTPLVEISRRLGGWPMAMQRGVDLRRYNPFSVVADMTRLADLSPLVSVFAGIDNKHTSKRIVTIGQPSLSMDRASLLDNGARDAKMAAYRRWISATALAMADAQGITLDRRRLAVDAAGVVAFEMLLANMTSESEEPLDSNYVTLTLGQLQSLTNLVRVRSPHAAVQWRPFVCRVFAGLPVAFDDEERVAVSDLGYLFKMVELLDRTPPRVIANYVQWCLISSLVADTTEEMRSLAAECERALTGTQSEIPRWRECVEMVTEGLGHAVGYKYVHTYFDLNAKTSAKEMVENIRAALAETMTRVPWMDNVTRTVALDKAAAMHELIGYPPWYHNASALAEYYKDLSVGPDHFANVLHLRQLDVAMELAKLREPVDPHEWMTSPETVNAFYSGQTNAIIFPAGILQPPLFSDAHLVALKYGAVGFFIGHEMTHGFDDRGRLADRSGNAASWWTPETDATFLRKAACFVRQYACYHVEDDVTGAATHLNGATTQSENIADNGGLRAAFHAYQRHVAKNGPEPSLPGLEQFSPEQLFFIGFATTWCETLSRPALLRQILTDGHSPKRFRVTGTVSNSQEFSRAFQCPPGAPMNPVEKCRVW